MAGGESSDGGRRREHLHQRSVTPPRVGDAVRSLPTRLAVVDEELMARDTPSTPWEASSWLRKRCSSPYHLGQLRDPPMPSLIWPEAQAPEVRSWALFPPFTPLGPGRERVALYPSC